MQSEYLIVYPQDEVGTDRPLLLASTRLCDHAQPHPLYLDAKQLQPPVP